MSGLVERVMLLGSPSTLVGVVSEPPRGSRCETGVILLGAGLIHHVGPNRLHATIARKLAQRGLAVVRFDHRGIGDSGSRTDDKPFTESAVEETFEVMEWMRIELGVSRFVLAGLCSGAVTALAAAEASGDVAGAVLINGGGEGAGDAWDEFVYVRLYAQQYWRRSLFSADSWKRALTGRIQYRRLAAVLARQLKDRFFPAREVEQAADDLVARLRATVERGVRLLWFFSEGDQAREYFDVMLRDHDDLLAQRERFQVEIIPFADHVCTLRANQQQLIGVLDRWFEPYATADASAAVEPSQEAVDV